MISKVAILAAAGAFAAAFGGTAQAGSIIGLVDGKTLVMIDPASRKVTATMPIKGADMLHGIDVRPADGMLYGVASGGAIVTIDPKTGQVTQKSKLSETLKSSSDVTIDFNPAADRLRILTTDGTSLRINVDDGKATVDGSLKYKEGDANAGKTPKVIAGSYTNSMKDQKATALYNIDAATSALVMQAPPNDGILNTVGAIGMTVEAPAAFNIVASAPDKNDAWLAAGGNLYSVDLKTGNATMAGKIEGLSGKLTDIAWWE